MKRREFFAVLAGRAAAAFIKPAPAAAIKPVAAGGYIPRSTVCMIGERGPEMVIPLGRSLPPGLSVRG